MIVTVSTNAALSAALKSAQPGDTVLLTSGSYSALSVSNLNFSTDVTIASQNPSAPAIITGLNVTNSSGMLFRDIEFVADPAYGSSAMVVGSSQDINFDRIHVHGSLDNAPGNDTGGLLVRSSTDVSVTNSEFEQLHWGVAHLNDTRLTITGNTFHDLRMDGVRGSGSSFVTISKNSFTDFYPITGDHADAIQFWTSGASTAATDIVIADNIFSRGNGAVAQGIFMRDELTTLHYDRVTITGNLISGGLYHGITVMGALNVKIDANVVQGFTDVKSWIMLEWVTGGSITNSVGNAVIVANSSGVTQSNNGTIAQASDGGAAVIAQWYASHGGGGGSSIPANLLLTGTGGADTLVGGSGTDTLNGVTGVDDLRGGSGSDLYITDGKAKITEFSGGGTDTVKSSGSFTLSAYLDRLELTGSAAINGRGNDLGNFIKGNSAANLIEGMAGADTLNGRGGNDTLVGGAGTDRFEFQIGGGDDRITDASGAGTDILDISAFLKAGYKPTLVDSASGVTVSFSNGDSIFIAGMHPANLKVVAEGYVF